MKKSVRPNPRSKVIKYFLLISCLPLLFFFFARLSEKICESPLPETNAPLQFYSNQVGSDFQLLFCQALATANESIYLEMYAITDPAILSLLEGKSHQNIDLRIFADKKATAANKKTLGRHLTFHRGKGLMHRKVLVIDHDLVLLGSTNFTTASLRLHDNIALGLRNREIAHFFESPLETMGVFKTHGQTIRAWKLPHAGQAALQQILSSIEQASDKIHVAMFTLTHSLLIDGLIAAKKRGVEVVVAIDYYTANGSSRKMIDRLADAGVAILISRGQQLFHHKWACIDEKTLFIGSANWTKSAFTCNKDCIVAIEELTPSQKNFLENLWKAIDQAQLAS